MDRTAHQGPRVLVIGLDGAGPDLLQSFAARGVMPNLARLLDGGARLGPLESTVPATTFPAWTSFLTGADPSHHGVPDFTVRRGYRVRFVGAASRRLPTFLTHLEDRGLRCGTAWFPTTYPPEPLTGYQISGWDSPVTGGGDASFVHPRDLHGEIRRQFGDDHLLFAAVDEFSAGADRHRELAAALPRRVRRRAEIACWLLANRPVDVAAFYFGETDTAAHHLWPFHDETSPRRPDAFPPELATGLEDTYRAVDDALAALVSAAGEAASLVVLSDHGSGGASDLAFHINRALAAGGLLAFRRGRRRGLSATTLRGRLPELIPGPLRRGLFRAAGGLAPSLLESRLRFGGIDWSRTLAFSEELPYAPSVWFNQRDREPRGRLRPADREPAARAVERALSAARAPDGARLVRRVIRREEIHTGPHAALLPDLALELARPGGHTPVALPSGDARGPVTRRLPRAELLGRKGRSLPGCHTPEGVLLTRAAPGTEEHPRAERIEQVAAVICALAGAPAAPWSERGISAPAPRRAYSGVEERRVAARLRRLGYLEG